VLRCLRRGRAAVTSDLKMPILECRRVVFLSRGDEAAFFGQLQANRGIRRVEGVGDTLHVHALSRLSEQSLRDLIATFHRYRIRMDQLAQFSSDSNRRWFEAPQAYWFRGVFGRGKGRGGRGPARR
jgi:hypothetical protein